MAHKLLVVLKILLGVVFLTPFFLFKPYFFYPYVFPKVIIFQCLIVIIFVLFFYFYLYKRKLIKTDFTSISLCILLLGLGYFVSTLLGVDINRSFWGNHERMTGAFSLWHYILFYFLLSGVINNDKNWQNLIRLVLIIGFIIIITGIIQRYSDISFLFLRKIDRSDSFLGNPIYFGGFAVLLIFITGFGLQFENNRYWKIFAWIIIFLCILAVFFSGSRGPFLALFVSFGVFIVINIVGRFKKKYKILLIAAFLSLIILGIFLFISRKNVIIKEIPALGKLLNTTLKSGTVYFRLLSWESSVDAWLERPIFGWGLNNFNIGFNSNFPKEFNKYDLTQSWVDNAHNIFLNTLAEQGIFGFSIYFLLLIIILFNIFKAYKNRKINLTLFSLFITYFVAHLTQNLFIFENHSSYLMFFFMLGFLNHYSCKNKKNRDEKKIIVLKKIIKLKVIRYTLLCIIVILSVFLLYTNIKILYSSHLALKATRLLKQNPSQSDFFFKRAVNFSNPYDGDLRLFYINTFLDIFPQYQKTGQIQTGIRLLHLSYDEIKKNIDTHPMDIRYHILFNKIAIILCNMLKKCDYMKDAKIMIQTAIQLSPGREQLNFILADIYLILNKHQKAIKIIKKYISQYPKQSAGWVNLVKAYAYIGNKEKVIEILNIIQNKKLNLRKADKKILKLIQNINTPKK